MLCLGGGPSARRFQQSAGFIFNMYTTEMRRKLGGVAFVAQKKNLDGTITVDQPPTISDIKNLLGILRESLSNSSEHVDVSDIHNAAATTSSSHKFDEREMQKMIKRLIPYSQSL